MDFNYLYTSFDGRINRQPYWIASLVLLAIVVVIALIFAYLLGTQSVLGRTVNALIGLATAYPAAALMAKRLHDRDRPTWWAAIGIAPGVLINLANLFGVSGGAQTNTVDYVLGLALLVVFVWFLIELGFLRGTVGSNQYGADPLEGHATA